MDLQQQMIDIAKRAKQAARALAKLTTAQKNLCLLAMADGIEKATDEILSANAKDMEAATMSGMSKAMQDRLRLDEKRVKAMAEGLRQVASLPDPVGRILDERVRPNGLRLQKVSVPIGVIVIIYEARPNVTADAAGLCFKSGNATILRGGKEAINSNLAIANVMKESAKRAFPEFPEDAIQVIPIPQREVIPVLLSLTQYVDLCIPRGGEGLIRAVMECSKVPVIKHYKGVCHVYVHADADVEMARRIVVNAKCQRPAVCNAMETLLVDQEIAEKFLPLVARDMAPYKVEMRCDPIAFKVLHPLTSQFTISVKLASDQDWYTEYNDYIMNVRVVENVNQAIDHISTYGSAHSDAIVTANESVAKKFLAEVDSAAVYWNASTRFTDGGEFGMGAEIGISTDKVGARGPMGLEELTSYKWIGFGSGQIRT